MSNVHFDETQQPVLDWQPSQARDFPPDFAAVSALAPSLNLVSVGRNVLSPADIAVQEVGVAASFVIPAASDPHVPPAPPIVDLVPDSLAKSGNVSLNENDQKGSTVLGKREREPERSAQLAQPPPHLMSPNTTRQSKSISKWVYVCVLSQLIQVFFFLFCLCCSIIFWVSHLPVR